MDEGHPARDGWAQEVQHLLLYGRDREASDLAARHLLDDHLLDDHLLDDHLPTNRLTPRQPTQQIQQTQRERDT